MDFLKQPVFVNLTSPDYRIFLVRPKYSISWSEVMKNSTEQWKRTGSTFSDRYNNEILAESRMYIEISSRNTLGRLEMIDIAELKNIPCILMIHPDRDICPSM